MGVESPGRERRRVLVHTSSGSIEGYLQVAPSVRTLDFLNLSHRFVPLDATDVSLAGRSLDRGRLGINQSRIVFVAELGDDPSPGDRRSEAQHFSRERTTLHLADCEIDGFLHVRGIHDPITLLSRVRQPFVALTSASVVGRELDLAARFLALNPDYVLAVRDSDSVAVGFSHAAVASIDRPPGEIDDVD